MKCLKRNVFVSSNFQANWQLHLARSVKYVCAACELHMEFIRFLWGTPATTGVYVFVCVFRIQFLAGWWVLARKRGYIFNDTYIYAKQHIHIMYLRRVFTSQFAYGELMCGSMTAKVHFMFILYRMLIRNSPLICVKCAECH